MKSIPEKVYLISALILCALTVIFGEVVLNAAISGFELWLCCVMPSVFPFFVCVSLLKESGYLTSSSTPLSLYIGCALSGAPAGSKLCASLITDDAEDKLSSLCAVCNMASPAFMTGSLFVLTGSRAVVLPVALGHYAAAFIMLLLTYKKTNKAQRIKPDPPRPFSRALSCAITDGFVSSVKVCGVIIFFTVITALIIKIISLFGVSTLHPVLLFFLSLIEMTNGVAFLSGLSISFPLLCALVAFCISFGGLCIMMQTMTVAGINAKKYLLKKAETALLAGVISFVAAILIPLPETASSSFDEVMSAAAKGSVTLSVALLSSLLGVGFVSLLFINRTHRR